VKLLPIALILNAFLLPSAFAARPGSLPAHVSAELVSEQTSVQPGKSAWLGLHLKMKKGWHTYWRNPGDSGMPTIVKWKQLPEGFSASELEFPAPHRIEQPPLISFGYEDEVLLLTRIDVPANASGTAKLGGLAKWLECEKVCIPGQAQVSIELPVKPEPPATDPSWAKRFNDTRSQMPQLGLHADAQVTASKVFVTVKGPFPAGLESAEFFPYQKDVVTGDRPILSPIEGGYKIELQRAPGFSNDSTDASGVLTFRVGSTPRQVVELKAPLAAAASPILRMILFAMLGGLLLNLMPCVFPLISLKVLGLVEQAKHDHSKIRTHWLVFSFGTLLSFWVLAGILIALKSTGEKLGWGFQLQSPVFLGCLIALFFLLSLNLLGFFEIGVGLTGVGSKLLSRGGYLGSFFSGVLTTVVATPCSAPFMGTAIGFALSQSAGVAFLVFTSLGLGLLLPYLLLAAFPSLVKFLPRPGRWMEVFKQLLAFPLLATVIWLSWTLGLSAGVNAVAIAWLALLAFSFGIWGMLRLQSGRKVVAALGFALGVALIAFISQVPVQQTELARAAASDSDAISWRPYSKSSLTEARKSGKPVFVDFTAAWCITCQVNERLVFSSTEVKHRFKDLDFVALKADWTNRDPEIADALAEFGRSGIPLYVLYPRHGDPWLLPEVITPGIVLTELDKLAKQ
jgi:thiol:disulfide interchange protein DsbD